MTRRADSRFALADPDMRLTAPPRAPGDGHLAVMLACTRFPANTLCVLRHLSVYCGESTFSRDVNQIGMRKGSVYEVDV